MENKPIGEALDNLAKAEKSLDRASKLLADNVMNEAQNRERRALAELVAARKMFQKAVSDNPDAFGGDSQPEDAGPTAESLKTLNEKKLNEMAEFRNEAKAAQQFVEKTLQQQRTLEQETRTTPPTDYGGSANRSSSCRSRCLISSNCTRAPSKGRKPRRSKRRRP